MIPYYAPTYFGRVIFQHGSGGIVKWSEIHKKPSNLATRLSGAKLRGGGPGGGGLNVQFVHYRSRGTSPLNLYIHGDLM